MTLWIIIGSLVAIVAVFLVVMSIKDRKKAKVIKEENDKLDKKRAASRDNVLIFLNLLLKENSDKMNAFVPSVGDFKMSDIRNWAKKALTKFQNTPEFRFASESEENEDLINFYRELQKENSNNWQKKYKNKISKFDEEYKKIAKDPFAEYEKKWKKTIKDIYK